MNNSLLIQLEEISKKEYMRITLTANDCREILNYINKIQKEKDEMVQYACDLEDKICYLRADKKKAIKYIKEHCEIIRFADKNGNWIDKIGKVEGIPLLDILEDKNIE